MAEKKKTNLTKKDGTPKKLSSSCFKIGNKCAAGLTNTGNRSPYDLLKEADDLLNWSKLDTSLRLYGFALNKKYSLTHMYEFANREPVFKEAMQKCKEILALRREEKANSGELVSHVYNKTAHLYDHELSGDEEAKKDRQLERDIKMAEVQIKLKNAQDEVSVENIDKLASALNLISFLRNETESKKLELSESSI